MNDLGIYMDSEQLKWWQPKGWLLTYQKNNNGSFEEIFYSQKNKSTVQ